MFCFAAEANAKDGNTVTQILYREKTAISAQSEELCVGIANTNKRGNITQPVAERLTDRSLAKRFCLRA